MNVRTAIFLALGLLTGMDLVLMYRVSNTTHDVQEQVDGLKKDLATRDALFKKFQAEEAARYEGTLDLLRSDKIDPPLPPKP